MGTFSVTIELGDPQGQRWRSVEALADSGSTFSWAPADVLDELGVRPSLRREFELADGQVMERDLAQTWARYEGRTVITILVLGDPGSTVLLGAYTLEGLSLGVDPVNQRLVPVRALAKAVAARRGPTPSTTRGRSR